MNSWLAKLQQKEFEL